MLKLTITNTFFNVLTGNMLRAAAAIKHTELTHKELKKAVREDSIEVANILGVDPEVYIKEENAKNESKFTAAINELNTNSIPSVDNKLIRITSNEEEATFEFKEEFLTDLIDTSTNIFIGHLKGFAELYLAKRNAMNVLKAFEAKWKDASNEEEFISETKEPEVKETEADSTLEGAAPGTTYVDSNGIKLRIPSVAISAPVTISDEKVIVVHYLEITDKDGRTTYTIPPSSVISTVKAKEVNKALQERVCLPFSAMKAIRKAYPTLVKYYAEQA